MCLRTACMFERQQERLKTTSPQTKSMGFLSFGRDLKDLNRLREIVTILVEHGFHAYLARAKLTKHASLTSKITSDHAQTTPARVRETLEVLGPTFVKLGQILSLRPDLIPPEYCEELKRLQHQVAPLSFPVVKGVVESELKKPLGKVFKEFDHEPLAAASISQVHRAVLLDGTHVVVKVQRPGVQNVMARDIDIMEYIAERLDRHFPQALMIDIVKEFKGYTARELDFQFELRNTQKLHTFFAAYPDIVIPRPYEEHSTSKLLVLEYLDGIPMTDLARMRKEGFSTRNLVRIGVKAMVLQAFDLGIFHADAHPGNLLAMRRNGKEAFGFLDFGIVSFLDEELQRNYLDLLTTLVQADVRGVADIMLKIGSRGPKFDYDTFHSELSTLIMDWHGTDLSEERMSQCIYRVVTTTLRNHVVLPANAVLFAKAFVTMEGSVTYLDPSFDLGKELRPKLEEMLRRRYRPAAVKSELLRDAREFQHALSELPRAAETLISKIEDGEMTLSIDKNEFRRAEADYDSQMSRKNLALICAAFFVGSALIAGLATELQFLGAPLYEWGFGLFIVTLALFIHLTIKTHKYMEREV
jgi:ubiquinone biosynthesis protein